MERKRTDTHDDHSEEENGIPAKVRKKSKAVEREFSSQEISKLKDTEALFHSSLFRLQVSELLKEVSVKQKLTARLEDAAEYLKGILSKISASEECKITDRSWLEKKSVKIPISENPAEVKGTFQFLPPVEVKLSGSSTLQTMVKPNVSADMLMVMPQTCFQPKDFLNQRYTRKRALYLCTVASQISKKKRVEGVKFFYFMGNPHKPVLLVTVRGSDGKNVKLCLHAVPEIGTFKSSRFHVNKNNVRPRWFSGETGGENDEDPSSLPATPFYNSSILHDVCCDENDSFLQRTLGTSEGIRDAIILLKVWLRQRDLLQTHAGFSSYLMTCYVSYLLMTKKLNKMMNSYQVFRTTLLFLSKSDWISEPPSLYQGEQEKSQPSVDELRATGACVFVDRTGFYNLAYMITPFVFARVKSEAELALEALDQRHQNCFEILFMAPVTFARRFDHVFHISLHQDVVEKALDKVEGLRQLWMDTGRLRFSLGQHILGFLSEALKDRVTLMQIKPNLCVEWDIHEAAFSYDNETTLTVGLILNTANAFNVLDKGPPAETPAAKEFCDFWGEKSEMRRFKDGTIHEAVLWTTSTTQMSKRRVCKRIVEHVLNRHVGIPEKCISYMEGKLDPLLQINHHTKNVENPYGTGEEESLTILHAFDQLNKIVRSLTSLPLAIHSIQGIHSIFRHADVFPPLPGKDLPSEDESSQQHALPTLPKKGAAMRSVTPVLEVICMLEGSGKWPEEVEAIQCMKALLHVKMGAELKKEHQLPVKVHKHFVDVAKDGFVFRLKIANTRELAVLRMVKSDDGMVKFKDTEESLTLEKEIVALPLLTSLLHSVQQEYPVFSATVRLCKRWFAAQMLWGLLSEEALELIVTHIFISPHPFCAPGSPNAGFLRFLYLLSSFNWKSDPLMVNLNNEFTDEDLLNIPKEFTKNRATLPSMCIFTPHDKTGTRWTRPLPTEPILERLMFLARGALKIVEAQIIDATPEIEDFKTIFRPSLSQFDLIIQLLPKVNCCPHQGVDEKSDASDVEDSHQQTKSRRVKRFPVTEFNVPLKFFHNLQSVFGDIAMFFFDPFGGSVIGLAWKPNVFEAKDFRPISFPYRKPVVNEKETVKLNIDTEAVMNDIRVLGGGIVKSVTNPKDTLLTK